MPKISIIIPVYNAVPYLEDCLQSISNQSFTDFEISVQKNLLNIIEKGKKINIPKKINQRKEGKKSVTFSITETELDIFEKEARERGFKNKSEFLAFIINNI